MTLKREDIKKLVIQQMLQESLNNEGVMDWFRNLGKAGKTTAIKQEPEKGDTNQPATVDEKTLQKLGDFIQVAQGDVEISKLILQTPLGKKVFYNTSNKEEPAKKQPVTESLGRDYMQMMKKAGVNQKMVTGFIEVMKTNKKALAMLKQVGIDVSEKTDTQQQPVAQTGETTPTSTQTQTAGETKPASTPEQGKEQTPASRNLKPSQKGVKDTMGTEEYKKSIQGLSSVISNTLNIPSANAQKIIDDIWSQLGGKNGKFTKLTLLEQEFQLNLTKILQNNGVVGLRANNLINKIKEWAKQNSNFVTDSIGKAPPTAPEKPEANSASAVQPAKNQAQTQDSGHGDQAVKKAIERVSKGEPSSDSLEKIKSAANRTGQLSPQKEKLKTKSQEMLKKAQWSLSKDGEMSNKDKQYWIKQGGIVVAQEQLKEEIVEEIFNLLTGKIK